MLQSVTPKIWIAVCKKRRLHDDESFQRLEKRNHRNNGNDKKEILFYFQVNIKKMARSDKTAPRCLATTNAERFVSA